MRNIPLSREEFIEWITRAKITRPVDKVVYHHFYRPNTQQWKGLSTLLAVRDYHIKEFNTYDIGYHFIAGPDGTIWIGRDINRIGAHAHGANTGSVGIAAASDFDAEDPKGSKSYDTMLFIGAEVGKRCSVPLARHIGHREVPGTHKSCPGNKVNCELMRDGVKAYLTDSEFAHLFIDGYEVAGANAHNEDGKLVANSRALDRFFGWKTDWSDRFVPVRVYLDYKHVAITGYATPTEHVIKITTTHG